MVTDDSPATRDDAAPNNPQLAQVAQYWQRCLDSQRTDEKLQLRRSVSASNTHISDDEDDEDEDEEEVIDIDIDGDDDEDDDEGDNDSEGEYRYVHYRRRSSRGANVVSGLPLLCGNCGISFFSLQSVNVDGQDDCYCSGECKWSVIMYREMDRRMGAMRAARARASGLAATTTTTYDRDHGSNTYATDDAIACH